MANLCKPITAYDFHMRYNNMVCHMTMADHSKDNQTHTTWESLLANLPFHNLL